MKVPKKEQDQIKISEKIDLLPLISNWFFLKLTLALSMAIR